MKCNFFEVIGHVISLVISPTMTCNITYTWYHVPWYVMSPEDITCDITYISWLIWTVYPCHKSCHITCDMSCTYLVISQVMWQVISPAISPSFISWYHLKCRWYHHVSKVILHFNSWPSISPLILWKSEILPTISPLISRTCDIARDIVRDIP